MIQSSKFNIIHYYFTQNDPSHYVYMTSWTISEHKSRQIRFCWPSRAGTLHSSVITHQNFTNFGMLSCWYLFVGSEWIKWSMLPDTLNDALRNIILEHRCGSRSSHAMICFASDSSVFAHILYYGLQGVFSNSYIFIPSYSSIARWGFLFRSKKQNILLKSIQWQLGQVKVHQKHQTPRVKAGNSWTRDLVILETPL